MYKATTFLSVAPSAAVMVFFLIPAHGQIMLDETDYDSVFTPPGALFDSNLVQSSAPLTDLNSDGIPDYVIGVPAYNNEVHSGAAFVISGADGSIIHTLHPTGIGALSSSFGYSVSSTVDVDGDSIEDIIVGAPTWKDPVVLETVGAVELFSGATGVSIAAHKHTGLIGSEMGKKVVGLGDIDGNGFGDYAVGLPFGVSGHLITETGKIRLYFTTGVGAYTETEIDGASFGSSHLEPWGDVFCTGDDYDGDGYIEIVVGASAWNFGMGIIQVISPALHLQGLDPLVEEHGINVSNAKFGASVLANADFDGDGMLDIVVSAPRQAVAPKEVYVLDGDSIGTGTVLNLLSPIQSPFPDVLSMNFGSSITSLNGYDGCTAPSLAVATPNWPSGLRSGRVDIYRGSDGVLMTSIISTTADHFFGTSVAGIGDVDGDGDSDLAIGATKDAYIYYSDNDCIADINGSETVDTADLGALLGQYGNTCIIGGVNTCSADLNCDGNVDAADLGILIMSFGPCS